ncbi:hypothetical protein [Hymenobacter sp. IS2118]|uniref:hypothetical protein n=1 Tax=Hymenobacter sp. IS2118 TaxID=1505605 RepID=UPI000550B855|nr:hypothetical protein [Hymenobacter sp. IS2118]
MEIHLEPQAVALLYHQAKADFQACINDPDNAFLQEQVPLPLRDIVVREADVKLVFAAGSGVVARREVHLDLYDNGTWMGAYVSIRAATGERLDDRLVFH